MSEKTRNGLYIYESIRIFKQDVSAWVYLYNSADDLDIVYIELG